MPEVSVIIPNYNHAAYLHQRIQSVLEQTFDAFEVIILDDASTDNSAAIIEQYRNHEKVTCIHYNERNQGTFAQWTKGLALAQGRYIWIAESDDFAADSFLETVLAPFGSDQDVVVSSCRSVTVDETGKAYGLHDWMDTLNRTKWKKEYIENGAFEARHYLTFRNTLPNASAVVFKKIPGIASLVPEGMRFCGDWLFWKRLLLQKGKIAYTPLPLNFFRKHAQTTRMMADSEKALLRFAEYKGFVEISRFNLLENRYDWMLLEWLSLQHVLDKEYRCRFPDLHPVLSVRFFFLWGLAPVYRKLFT